MEAVKHVCILAVCVQKMAGLSRVFCEHGAGEIAAKLTVSQGVSGSEF